MFQIHVPESLKLKKKIKHLKTRILLMERELSARNLNFVERLKTNKLEQSFNKFNFGMNFFIHVPEYFFKI